MQDFRLMSASVLAQAIRSGRCRSQDVVEAHIRHIQAVNGELNALVFNRFDLARAEAKAADELVAKTKNPEKLPPLLGVPCTIKENFELKGTPQCSGLKSRAHIINDTDAPTVARIKDAGAIILGVTNTSELCMWMESHNSVYGRSRNPYDPSRIVGGSSGGEGAIIGAGGSPFGLGADVGGSIRMPAYFNGIFGHKPTPGIVPNAGQVPLPTGAIDRYCVTGPLCRSAEDLMPLMRILADQPEQLGDPATVDLSQVRLLWADSNGRHRLSKDLRHRFHSAVAELSLLMDSPRQAELPDLRHSFEIWASKMGAANQASFAAQLGQGQEIPVLRELLKFSLRRSDHTLPALLLAITEGAPLNKAKWQRRGDRLKRQLLEQMGPQGVLLFPTYSRSAPRHGQPIWRYTFDWSYCGIINVLELPSTQVPLGLGEDGLPLGLQVIAPPGQDHLSIAVAQALESRMGGWKAPF